MKKFMKSVVPVSALLFMLAGCAKDGEEDVDVDVNEEEPATDGEADVNIIEEEEGNTNIEKDSEENTETNPESNTDSTENGSDGTSNSNLEESPESDMGNGEDRTTE